MTMKTEAIAILMCRVGQQPEMDFLKPDSKGSYLEAMQQIVGGDVRLLQLEHNVALYFKENGEDLPLNRILPGVGPPREDFNFVVDRTAGRGARPGEPGEWRLHGDLFVSRTRNGRPVHLTSADLSKYQKLLKT